MFSAIFANYLVMMVSLAIYAQFYEIRTIKSGLPIYLWEYPITFAFILWALTRKRNPE